MLPKWERRGLPQELPEGWESVIRCMPEDKTNGFFVSCFERVSEGEESMVGGKRPREDEDEDEDEEAMDVEERAPKEKKDKTAAQLERNRRKKKQQKSKVTA